MVVVRCLAVTDASARNDLPPGLDPLDFYYVMLSDVLNGFPILVWLAFRFRSNPPAHKRLILIATLVLVDEGIIRWPIPWISESSLMVSLVTYSFPGFDGGLRSVVHGQIAPCHSLATFRRKNAVSDIGL
jgi:hypothetical protein